MREPVRPCCLQLLRTRCCEAVCHPAILLPGRADVGYIRFVAYFDTPCSGCRDIQSAERNGGYIRWQVPSGWSLTDAHLVLASAMKNFVTEIKHYSCRPRVVDMHHQAVIKCIQTSIVGLRHNVIAQYNQSLDGGVCTDDIEHATYFTLTGAQHFTGIRCMRQDDTMQMSFVAASIVQSRNNFLTRIAALVDGDGVQTM